MLRVLLLILLALHGSIHLMGFLKAIHPGSIAPIKQSISSQEGVFWLIAAILFLAAGTLFLLHKNFWWVVALAAGVLSQYLIILFWNDARFGTIANILIFIAIVVGIAQWKFEGTYRHDIHALQQKKINTEVLTEDDLKLL
ncbi:MAG TPA: hypothetical protein VLA58_04335, partial [Chitinophagaceae bacterium]|nr:hypothetical protein [Chitinophagaceae bacterium]